MTTPTPSPNMPTPEQVRVREQVHDGDYVEVVKNHVQGDPYIGKRGFVLGQPWNKDAPQDLPIALMLEDDPAFGPTFFHPDELKVITPGSASRQLRDLLAQAEAQAAREGKIMEHFQAAHDALQRRADEGRIDFNIAARVVETQLEAAKRSISPAPAEAPK